MKNRNLIKKLMTFLPYVVVSTLMCVGFGSWITTADPNSEAFIINVGASDLVEHKSLAFHHTETNMIEYNRKHYKVVDNKNPIDDGHPGFVKFTFITLEKPMPTTIRFNFTLKIFGIKSSMIDYVPDSFLLPTGQYWQVISENKFDFDQVQNNSQSIRNKADKIQNANFLSDGTFTLEFRLKDFSANRNWSQALKFNLSLEIIR